jgi:nucleoside-diphosphate-sugar epimerase
MEVYQYSELPSINITTATTTLPLQTRYAQSATMPSPTPAIPSDSWVLVIGASGFLASHIVLNLLKRGCRVRGTVRDTAQSTWLTSGRFKSYADSGHLELVSIPDFTAVDAFQTAIKGCAAVLHTAYVTNIVPDPNLVITPLVDSVHAVIHAAAHEPSVKRVIFTGSAAAASPLTQGGVDNGTITRDSWNEDVLKAAWAPPPYGMAHAMANYTASKVAQEQEVWKMVREEKLPFTVNTVSPAGIIGEPLDVKHIDGQANWVMHAYNGNKMMMDPMPACE